MINYLEHCVYNWGQKASIINKTYLECKKEASFLGQDKNPEYLKEMLYDVLCGTDKLCADRFIESKIPTFQEFIDSLLDEELIDEEILSTGFAISQKPEVGPIAKPVTIGLDGEDENKKNQHQQDEI